MSERQLIVNDGRVYWLHPDGFHIGLSATDAMTINALQDRVDHAEHVAAIAEFNEKAALRHIAALEARVAKLEAALREIGREQSAKTATVAADKFQLIARAALLETVEA